MAAYRPVDDLITCGLTACTPGSALGTMLGNEYGKPLPFAFCIQCIFTTILHRLEHCPIRKGVAQLLKSCTTRRVTLVILS